MPSMHCAPPVHTKSRAPAFTEAMKLRTNPMKHMMMSMGSDRFQSLKNRMTAMELMSPASAATISQLL